MLKIRRQLGRLIFNMGIAIPGKIVFLIETAPCLLDMKDIFDIQCAKFHYKFKHSTLPSYFEKYFVRNNQIHNHFTRNRENLHMFPTKRSRTNECIRHYMPTLINDLPKELKAKIDTHSLSGFTNSYKRKLLSNYPEECLERNCYICGRVWY